ATPVTVRNVQDARGVDAGRMHACAVTERGAVFCWGSNDWGQLGTSNRRNPSGNLAARVVGLRGAVGVTTGSDHSCAITSRGQVQCWGKNDVGQLGDGTRELRSRPTRAQGLTATSVAAGGHSTCAVRADGVVACWGDLTGTERPVAIDGFHAPAVDVAVGDESACARLSDGRVVCWGSGAHGTLGPSTMAASDIPVPVDGLPPAVSIRMGATRACAVDAQGLTWCWGSRQALAQDSANPNRQAGLGLVLDTVANRDATCSALQSGGVCCWGVNRSGLLGVGFQPFASPAREVEWPIPMQW
ncbi:MAG: RCC1 domain-containing protein, partial [Sandaracinaceae bacterium]